MQGTVTIVLADGSAAVVSVAAARAIANLLWDMGPTPGAVTAATRISEEISAVPALRRGIAFSAREDAPLRLVADGSVDWRLPTG
jgi:hypothetical protein